MVMWVLFSGKTFQIPQIVGGKTKTEFPSIFKYGKVCIKLVCFCLVLSKAQIVTPVKHPSEQGLRLYNMGKISDKATGILDCGLSTAITSIWHPRLSIK